MGTTDPTTTDPTTNDPTTNDPTTDDTGPTTRPPPSPIACTYANNTLGSCGCNGQLWIAHQCHSGFFCLVEEGQVVPGTNAQGCEIECAADEILVVDPHNGGSWECHKTNENTRPLICPGRFNTECASRLHRSKDLRARGGDCAVQYHTPLHQCQPHHARLVLFYRRGQLLGVIPRWLPE